MFADDVTFNFSVKSVENLNVFLSNGMYKAILIYNSANKFFLNFENPNYKLFSFSLFVGNISLGFKDLKALRQTRIYCSLLAYEMERMVELGLDRVKD